MRLSSLVAQAESGAEIIITRRGKPVVKLVAAAKMRRRPSPDIAEQVRALRAEIERKHGVDETFDWEAAIEEGRR